MTTALQPAPDDPFFPLGALTPNEKQFLRNVPRAYCAQAPTTRGPVRRGSMPRLVFLFPVAPSRPKGRAASQRCGGARPRRTAPGVGTRARRGCRLRALGDRGGHSAAGARGAASSRAPAARQDEPGQRSQRQGESDRSPNPVLRSCPAGRRSLASSGQSPGTPARPDAPASPHPFPAASPSSPSPLPPPPNPPPEWKIPPGAGGAGPRLSEGQPTVTNGRRGSGGAGFPSANPEAGR